MGQSRSLRADEELNAILTHLYFVVWQVSWPTILIIYFLRRKQKKILLFDSIVTYKAKQLSDVEWRVKLWEKVDMSS